MKIDFVATDPRDEVGSYRIWVRDLSKSLKSLGVDCRTIQDPSDLRHDCIGIFSKGDYSFSKSADCIAKGAINIPCDEVCSHLDFVIVGSIEEKLSMLKNNDNVHVVNLIEAMYENFPLKDHAEKDTLEIVYHGSYTHLPKIHFGFSEAYQKLTSEGIKLSFKTITNEPGFAKQICDQLKIPADHMLWDISDVAKHISDADIGIVPNCTDMSTLYPAILKHTDIHCGLYSTDYALRFKNKSNPGRNFVFYQLGIPVISDLTPSNMVMLHDEKCGRVAVCSRTWELAIRSLLSPVERSRVASHAKQRFSSLYNRDAEANSLISFLEKLL